MKILMLNYEFQPLGGGAGNASYYLLKEFSKYKDLEIDLVTSSTDKLKIQKFSKNITIHYLDINKKGNIHYQTNKDLINYSMKARKYCKSLIKENKYDLTHAFFGIPCGYIAMKLGIPYIVSLRGSDVPFYNPRFKYFDKFLFKRLSKKIWNKAKNVIANSKDLKELALKASPEQDIKIIHNGIDKEEFIPANKPNRNSKITLISTGRLIKRKGYEYLIQAISNNKNIELQLIGEGNLKSNLQKLANKVKANVYFLGNKEHSEISKFLQKADIFVLPSLNEGMSNSILEAMASGLPIITTDTGGASELIKDNGYIVEKASFESISKALNNYISHKQLISEHSIKSRKIAERMSWNHIASQYFQEYKKWELEFMQEV